MAYLRTKKNLWWLEGVAVGGVEGPTDVPRQFQVLDLVMPHGNMGSTEYS